MAATCSLLSPLVEVGDGEKVHGGVRDVSSNSERFNSRTGESLAFELCHEKTCGKKGADQLHGLRAADLRLCFRCIDSTIPLLPKSETSSF